MRRVNEGDSATGQDRSCWSERQRDWHNGLVGDLIGERNVEHDRLDGGLASNYRWQKN